MTEGAGLRQSHFGSGYDAGKARLQAEVEQLRAQVAAQAEQLAEYESMNGAQLEMRGIIESHMDMARMEWECVKVVEAAQREERRHIQKVDDLTRLMPADKQVWYRQAHTASCDLAGVLALARLDAADVPATSHEPLDPDWGPEDIWEPVPAAKTEGCPDCDWLKCEKCQAASTTREEADKG